MPTQVPICFVCHRKINGRYSYDWAGHNICLSHLQTVTKCASCGQFCDSHAKDIGLGMKICSHCQKYRIERADCESIIRFVKNIYRNSPIGNVAKWKLVMVDAQTLYKKTKDKNTRGLAQAVGTEYTIFIYRELSRVAFAQVLAHELLHIYQYANHIQPPKAICEGFCNLGSYIILSAINNKEAKAAIDNLKKSPDPIYGDGFRLLLASYESGGWQAAIRKIRGI